MTASDPELEGEVLATSSLIDIEVTPPSLVDEDEVGLHIAQVAVNNIPPDVMIPFPQEEEILDKDTEEDKAFRYPPLTDEQLSLVSEHMSLVPVIARPYNGQTFTKDDIQQEGMAGLILAARRFDPTRGISFVAFAKQTIKGEILKAIRDRDRVVRPNRAFFERDVLLDDAIKTINENGGIPTDQAIANLTGYSVEEVREKRVKMIDFRTHDFGTIVNSENGSVTEDQRALVDAEATKKYDDSDDRALVAHMLEKLTPLERIILLAKEGIPPFDRKHSQTEIAKMIGKSQIQVSRLRRRALEKLGALLAVDESIY